MKGTCATTDFPSCVGVGVLQNCFAKKDSELCAILKDAGAVLMGKRNQFNSLFLAMLSNLVIRPPVHIKSLGERKSSVGFSAAGMLGRLPHISCKIGKAMPAPPPPSPPQLPPGVPPYFTATQRACYSRTGRAWPEVDTFACAIAYWH